MKQQLVSKFKFFWDDNDHVVESWLEDMARQGLHLQRVDCLRLRFVFARGEPADMAYRIDFRMKSPSPDHIQLFSDAGWDRVDESLGWQFWRAPKHAGRTPEIFTDTESRIGKYQRMLWLLAICMGLYVFTLIDKGARAWDTTFEIVLHPVLIGLAAYSTARLLLRIHKLRNPE